MKNEKLLAKYDSIISDIVNNRCLRHKELIDWIHLFTKSKNNLIDNNTSIVIGNIVYKLNNGKYDNYNIKIAIDNLINRVINKEDRCFKKGDILMHPVFRHPYILLKKKKGYWICGLMTSDGNCLEILEKVESNILKKYKNHFFTKVIFTSSELSGKYLCRFDNKEQLKSLLKKLKKVMK
jgi:hypothetical protein